MLQNKHLVVHTTTNEELRRGTPAIMKVKFMGYIHVKHETSIRNGDRAHHSRHTNNVIMSKVKQAVLGLKQFRTQLDPNYTHCT